MTRGMSKQIKGVRQAANVKVITPTSMISELIEPEWLIKKTTILNDIDKEMKRRDSYQGIKCK